MRRIRTTCALALVSLAFAAAVRADDDHEGGEGSGGKPGKGKGGDAAKGASIYSANCASCHAADARGGRGPNIRGRSAGDVFEAVREGEDGMPRFKGIKKADAKDIAAFLRDPDAALIPPPTPTPAPATPPTWNGEIGALFAQSCATCHKGSKSPAGVKLDTYANVAKNAARALSAIQGGRMPPGGPLPAAKTQAVADWVTAGKPK